MKILPQTIVTREKRKVLNRGAKIIIDSQALQHNYQRVHALAPTSSMLAMVKANGYGHGIANVARALPKVDAFGVACLIEALHLRQANISQRIVLMPGVMSKEELDIALQYNIELVVHQKSQLELLEQQALVQPIHVWLKINTGMNRLGFSPEEAIDVYQRLQKNPQIIKPLKIFTHFASSELVNGQMTVEQMKSFYHITQHFNGELSLANSGAILAWPESHADWIRPGLLLYGASPLPDKTGLDHDLKPVMTWCAKLIAVHQRHKGDAIGYNSQWVCPEDMLVGVVGVGYGDGYPLHAQNGTPVLVNGKIVPLAGRVSMDMLTVDLRTQPNAKTGDDVVLWGKGLPVEIVARYATTSAYELLCNARVR